MIQTELTVEKLRRLLEGFPPHGIPVIRINQSEWREMGITNIAAVVRPLPLPSEESKYIREALAKIPTTAKR